MGSPGGTPGHLPAGSMVGGKVLRVYGAWWVWGPTPTPTLPHLHASAAVVRLLAGH